ncbi:hypothetical protein BGX31_001892, partial [Mortierella sp. GBA43]
MPTIPSPTAPRNQQLREDKWNTPFIDGSGSDSSSKSSIDRTTLFPTTDYSLARASNPFQERDLGADSGSDQPLSSPLSASVPPSLGPKVAVLSAAILGTMIALALLCCFCVFRRTLWYKQQGQSLRVWRRIKASVGSQEDHGEDGHESNESSLEKGTSRKSNVSSTPSTKGSRKTASVAGTEDSEDDWEDDGRTSSNTITNSNTRTPLATSATTKETCRGNKSDEKRKVHFNMDPPPPSSRSGTTSSVATTTYGGPSRRTPTTPQSRPPSTVSSPRNGSASVTLARTKPTSVSTAASTTESGSSPHQRQSKELPTPPSVISDTPSNRPRYAASTVSSRAAASTDADTTTT